MWRFAFRDCSSAKTRPWTGRTRRLPALLQQPVAFLLAALIVGLCVPRAGQADFTMTYVGNNFDPKYCTPAPLQVCPPGPISIRLNFTGDFPASYTGAWGWQTSYAATNRFDSSPRLPSVHFSSGTISVAGYPAVPITYMRLRFQNGVVSGSWDEQGTQRSADGCNTIYYDARTSGDTMTNSICQPLLRRIYYSGANKTPGTWTIYQSPYTVSADADASKPLLQRIAICHSPGDGTSARAASLITPDADCATREEIKAARCDAVKFATNISYVFSLVPSSVATLNPREVANDLVVDTAIQQIKPVAIKDKVALLSSIISFFKDRATGVVGYITGHASRLASEVSQLKMVDCKDPPDSEYHTVVSRSGLSVDAGFKAKFGSHYSQGDTAVERGIYALESLELAVISIQRGEGAILAHDDAAFSMQATATSIFLGEADQAFQQSQAAWISLGQTLKSDGGANPKFNASLLGQAQTILKNEGIPTDLRAFLKTKLGLTDSQIAGVLRDVVNLRRSDIAAPAGLSLFSMPAELGKLLSNSQTFRSIR